MSNSTSRTPIPTKLSQATARRHQTATPTPGHWTPGHPYARDSSFRPFPPGPNASCRGDGAYFGWGTCLPQDFPVWETGVPPAYQEAVEAFLGEADPDGPEPEAGQ